MTERTPVPLSDPTIDPSTLARAMSELDYLIDWPRWWTDDSFEWVARQVAAEYTRLREARS